MTIFNFVLLVIGILAAWIIASWAVWMWGPGEVKWAVWCPVHKKAATIIAVQRTAAVVPACAGVQVYDVKRCSLFGNAPVNCRKECLQRP